eukprot:1139290-Pelagomonas_calceolata.AAC.3
MCFNQAPTGNTSGCLETQHGQACSFASLTCYTATPPPPVRPTVSYPTFGRPKFQMPAPVEMIPHRRPATKILKELEEEMERQRSQRPMPKGTLCADDEVRMASLPYLTSFALSHCCACRLIICANDEVRMGSLPCLVSRLHLRCHNIHAARVIICADDGFHCTAALTSSPPELHQGSSKQELSLSAAAGGVGFVCPPWSARKVADAKGYDRLY